MDDRYSEKVSDQWSKWTQRTKKWNQRFESFKNTSYGRRIIRIFKFAFLLGIVGYLIYQLNNIGVRQIIKNLPTHPAFYLIYAFLYLSVPLGEVIIYKLFWKFSFLEGLRTFIIKKVLNQDIVQYSGEVYLFNWAKKRLDLESKEVFQVVKDNNIVSSVTATITAISLLAYFIYFSDVDILNVLDLSTRHLVIIYAVVATILTTIFIFRNRIFSVAKNKIAAMWFVHQMRLLLTYAIEILQWTIVVPGVPLFLWFSLLSVKIIMSRIPFIPNHDLVYTGISIEVAKSIQLPEAAIAGIFLVNMTLNKVVNLVLFAIFNTKLSKNTIKKTT